MALDKISLEVSAGESFGIIGPNGAGKSTLLKLIAGVIDASSGSVQVSGRTAALIELGTGFHPDLTGRENVSFSAAALGMGRKELSKSFEEIVAFAGIDEYLDTPVKRYSSGMAARLGFAVASHLSADVLVLDEVLAVGDAAFQLKCHERIRALRDGGCATIYVTHALWTLPILTQRAMLLSNGRCVSVGSAEDMVRLYEEQPGRDPQNSVENGVRWLDDITLASNELSSFGALDVSIQVMAVQDLPNARVVIGIEGSDKAMVAGSFLDLRPISADQRVKVSCRVGELPLLPGDYTLHVSLFAKSDSSVVLESRPLRLVVAGVPVPRELWGRSPLRAEWSTSEATSDHA